MSNYQTFAIRPNGTEEEPVVMLDNHFGKRRYGVMFPDGKVFMESNCTFKDVVENNKIIIHESPTQRVFEDGTSERFERLPTPTKEASKTIKSTDSSC